MSEEQPKPEVVDAQPQPQQKSRVLVLLATIPARQQSCNRLLKELLVQKRVPDGIILVLDGYAALPGPTVPPGLSVVAEHRFAEARGAGARWQTLLKIPPEDIVVCLDDDTMLVEAPLFIKRLVETVEKHGGAAAAMGRGVDNKPAPPDRRFSRGELIHGAGMGLTVRAKYLRGLVQFAADVKAAGGPDCLAKLGDDDALVSAYLWKQGIKIHHAATGNVFAAPGTRTSSQTTARRAKHENLDAQKLALQKTVGWPWALKPSHPAKPPNQAAKPFMPGAAPTVAPTQKARSLPSTNPPR